MNHAEGPRRAISVTKLLHTAAVLLAVFGAALCRGDEGTKTQSPAAPARVPTILVGGRSAATDLKWLSRSDAAGAPAEIGLAVDGDSPSVTPLASLVRFGNPAEPSDAPALVLVDGSRIGADGVWRPSGLVRLEADQFVVRRGLEREWVVVPRGLARLLLFEAARARLDPQRYLTADDEGDNTGNLDRVWLVGGDVLSGTLQELGGEELTLAVDGADEPIRTPLGQVLAVRLASEADPPVVEPACVVGLDDGSILYASACEFARTSGEGVITTACGVQVVARRRDIALVQPGPGLLGAVRYLSDADPVDYRHTPYFTTPWPLERDRGLPDAAGRAQPLLAGGLRYARGLAMHSAARVVYAHDGSPAVFRSECAVADAPPGEGPGSVSFRVYAVRDGRFELASDAPLVRTGDPPRPLSANLAGAAGLALVVDFADNGDTGDNALWLDARIEPPMAPPMPPQTNDGEGGRADRADRPGPQPPGA